MEEVRKQHQYEKSFLPMSKMIIEKLINNGMSMIVEKDSRNDTIIDHVYTNNDRKIIMQKKDISD